MRKQKELELPERTGTASRGRSGFHRFRLRLYRRNLTAGLLAAGLFFGVSAVASYHRVSMVRAPFHYAAAGFFRLAGVPVWMTVQALNDGLLKVYFKSGEKGAHDWFRAGNPSGIDYEAELRALGWSERRLHALGSLLNVSDGPF